MSEKSQLISQFYIKLNGADVPQELMRAVLTITVENSLHMPDVVALILHDPRLQWIDDDRLRLGSALEIYAKSSAREAEENRVFDGEIVEIEPEFGPSTHQLTVRAFDRLHRLSRGRQVRSFQNVTDSDVAEQLAKEVGLQTDVKATRRVHEHLLQFNQTNLEFLRQRATEVGYMLYVVGKKLCFKPPTPEGRPIPLQWGENLSEFRPRLTTVGQVGKVRARAWDPNTRQELFSEVSEGEGRRELGRKQSGGATTQEAFHQEPTHFALKRPLRTQEEADRLAQAVADRIAERFIEAEGVCGGNPSLVAGASVNIKALGSQFSGTYFVTATTHIYNMRQGYLTRFHISGQTPATLLHLLRDPEDDHQPFLNLAIGVVTDNADPQGWGRVKVKYPWLSSEHTSYWARVVAVGGGAERGIAFLPEINDEVLVGFELGDAQQPYVIGGLWNGKDAPPKAKTLVNGGRVQQRVLRSRSGHTITLDDEGKKVLIESSGDLAIEAKGEISIKCDGKLDLGSKDEVTVQGSIIKLN